MYFYYFCFLFVLFLSLLLCSVCPSFQTSSSPSTYAAQNLAYPCKLCYDACLQVRWIWQRSKLLGWSSIKFYYPHEGVVEKGYQYDIKDTFSGTCGYSLRYTFNKICGDILSRWKALCTLQNKPSIAAAL